MKPNFTEYDRKTANDIISCFMVGDPSQGVEKIHQMCRSFRETIPDNLRASKGITWILKRVSQLLIEEFECPDRIHVFAEKIYENLAPDEILVGIPIFLIADCSKSALSIGLDFFRVTGNSTNWVVREFTVVAVHKLIRPHQELLLPWLKDLAWSDQPNLRRLAGEALRPVAENRWLAREPEKSLEILQLLYQESKPYARTSVGNNLSDLAKQNPELILETVKELVASGNPNSYWIAYRACRNMVKKDPEKIMKILGVDEYHYKDRNFHKNDPGGI